MANAPPGVSIDTSVPVGDVSRIVPRRNCNIADAARRDAAAMNSLQLAFLSLAYAATLAGCATSSDCGGDWYATGQRDGRLGATPQADLYARRCPAVDAERYGEGWRNGFAQRPRPVVLISSPAKA
jgi:hypothetical protein